MIWKQPPVAASASDHWETRLTTAHVERVSTSEARQGPIQRESRWSRRPQDGGCCRRPSQWHLPRCNHQWLALALATFWDFLTLAEHHLILKMFAVPSTLNLSDWNNWRTWEKKVPIQNLMLFSKHGVMQRVYWGHSTFFIQWCIIVFGDTQLMPLIHCCGIQMCNYH